MTRIDEIIDNFTLLEEWDDRYRYLIELGRKLPAFPDAWRSDAFKVEGCASQVWIVPRIDGTTTLVNSWISDAPSSLAASRISLDTPLIAAENTTMAKPVWSQIRIIISAGRLIGKVVAQAIGSKPKDVQMALRSPYCGWLGGAQA